MMDESLPCPVCGGRAWANYEPTIIRIYCPCCDIVGPKKDTIEEARAAWNTLPRSLAWTDEPPKVPGWYWCRDAEGEIRLRQLENFVGGPRLFVCGISKHIFPDELTGIQWAGPIPEPREPK